MLFINHFFTNPRIGPLQTIAFSCGFKWYLQAKVVEVVVERMT